MKQGWVKGLELLLVEVLSALVHWSSTLAAATGRWVSLQAEAVPRGGAAQAQAMRADTVSMGLSGHARRLWFYAG